MYHVWGCLCSIMAVPNPCNYVKFRDTSRAYVQRQCAEACGCQARILRQLLIVPVSYGTKWYRGECRYLGPSQDDQAWQGGHTSHIHSEINQQPDRSRCRGYLVHNFGTTSYWWHPGEILALRMLTLVAGKRLEWRHMRQETRRRLQPALCARRAKAKAGPMCHRPLSRRSIMLKLSFKN